ncbi:MAG: rod shape-determining protein MreC [Candidatus Wildermuthbacteria bacterium RIFCSPLOWO2_01_FULL_50_46]|nr:MAG: MreC [Parcubacteria group bacterium GW2011_GWA1_49_26]OHA75185.1 MAG: rod shape-determining protein MreC [Candidatus Wildermuthbacteria bacterium RIFCSPLOWO2_01_FULL_50_46]
MRGVFSKRKLVIGAMVLLFLFSLNLISPQVRSVVISVSLRIQTPLWQAGDIVATFFGGGRLRVENETLKQENFALLQRLVSLQYVEKENEELRSMMGFGLAEEFEMVLAEVVGKNLMEDVITVRAGKNQGVREGMPVVAASNVAVGRVVEAFPNHARVQLITANGSRLDAKVRETQAAGVVRGQGGSKLLFDVVPREDELQVGDLVVTMGEVFPRNLLVGQAQEIFKSGTDDFQRASLEPFLNIKSLETVFVITSLRP